MRKFTLTFITTLTLMLMFASSVFAAPAVNVVINGTPVTFTESSGAPFIDNNNRTLVPMRVVMEQYGCTVSWDQSTKTASVVAGDTTVLVPIGQSYITVNGEQRTIDAPAQIVSGRTYLPIRAVLEAFGANVGWDNTNRSVTVAGEATSTASDNQPNSNNSASNTNSNSNSNNNINSNGQMSYDEFIGLFDIEIGEYSKTGSSSFVTFYSKSMKGRQLVELLERQYIQKYMYKFLSEQENADKIRGYAIYDSKISDDMDGAEQVDHQVGGSYVNLCDEMWSESNFSVYIASHYSKLFN